MSGTYFLVEKTMKRGKIKEKERERKGMKNS